jgi:uncharacterized membrane protein
MKENNINHFKEIKALSQVVLTYMAECPVPTKKGLDALTTAILIGLTVFVVFAIFLTLTNTELAKVFLPGDADYVPGGIAFEVIYILLTIATDVLYFLGAGVIAFGAALLTVRFVQCKLKNPYQPSCVSRYLSGYLTLSLEFFIGAELIKTVVVRTYEEFLVLILVIFSRGLFSLILYLERRWHGGTETE